MDTATRVQIFDEADCIPHSTNTFGKRMNSVILHSAMIEIVEQIGFFSLDMSTRSMDKLNSVNQAC